MIFSRNSASLIRVFDRRGVASTIIGGTTVSEVWVRSDLQRGALEAEGNELERRAASNQVTADDFRSTFTVDKVCNVNAYRYSRDHITY
jgi:hypothetical protein